MKTDAEDLFWWLLVLTWVTRTSKYTSKARRQKFLALMSSRVPGEVLRANVMEYFSPEILQVRLGGYVNAAFVE